MKAEAGAASAPPVQLRTGATHSRLAKQNAKPHGQSIKTFRFSTRFFCKTFFFLVLFNSHR
jgi:hypothetical protein